MSASTELLLEQIVEQENAIRAAAECGHDTKQMQLELRSLRARLFDANRALNEGRAILKD